MKLLNLVSIVMICFCCKPIVDAGTPLVLVKNGKPAATLILSERTRQATDLAVSEFQHYLKKITGSELPVSFAPEKVKGTKVFIGESDAVKKLGYKNKDLKPEEYVIKTGKDYLLITGKDHNSYGPVTYEENGVYPGFKWHHDLGALWGVYDFLEKQCGVRWYFPSDLGTIVPEKSTLEIRELNIKRRPWARHRWVAPRPCPTKLYYWNTASEPLYAKNLISARASNLWWLHKKLRNEPIAFSHGYTQFYRKYFKTNPEYFHQGYPNKGYHYSQPAFHKQEVVDLVAKNAIEHFDQPPEKRYWEYGSHIRNPNFFSVSPQDNRNWCKSPEAREKFPKQSPQNYWCDYASRYVWEYVNNVARKVGEKHPDKWISCHAYNQHHVPYPGMKLEPNVAVQFCRSLPDERDRELKQHNEKALDAWLKLKPGRLYLFEYFCFPQFRMSNEFHFWAPHVIAKDLVRMKKIGIRGAYNDIACVQVKGNRRIPYAWANPMLDFINFYIWFKYLDDQEQSVDAILNEMYKGLYGPAAKHIKAFVELGEKVYFSPERYKKYVARSKARGTKIGGAEESWTIACPPEKLKEFGRHIAAAHAAAKSTKQKRRVEIFDQGVYQMMKISSERWHKNNLPLTPENSISLPFKWKFKGDPQAKGKSQGWFKEKYNDQNWQKVSVCNFLEKQGQTKYGKLAWYRVDFYVASSRKGKTAILRLGAVDESYQLWVNGQYVSEYRFDPIKDSESWRKPVFVDISRTIRYGGENQITVLVENATGLGGIWKPCYIIFTKPQKGGIQ